MKHYFTGTLDHHQNHTLPGWRDIFIPISVSLVIISITGNFVDVVQVTGFLLFFFLKVFRHHPVTFSHF